MRRRRRLPLLVVLALIFTACDGPICTLIGGVPSISIDARAVAGDLDPEDVLVCVEDNCRLFSVARDDGVWFLDERRGSRRTIEVATTRGVTLAGPTEIEFDEYYPNGKACDPKVLRGTVVVDESGVIERVDTAAP